MKLREKLIQTLAGLLFCLLTTAPVWAAPNSGMPPGQQMPNRPGPGQSPGGPWNQDLDLYTSQDGRNFQLANTLVERAGVPNLSLGPDGTVYAVFQWFPEDNRKAFDRVAMMKSTDQGRSWSDPAVLKVTGLPENRRRVFDPTLVEFPNGEFRLYFSSERISEKQRRGNRGIYSAYSRDGIHFEFEEGERFGFPDQETYDVSVVFYRGKWHLFCPASMDGGDAFHAISSDGLEFQKLGKVSVNLTSASWIGNAAADGPNIRFYGSGRGNVWTAVSNNGSQWTLEDQQGLRGGDPSVLRVKNGTWLALITSPPRRNEPRQTSN